MATGTAQLSPLQGKFQVLRNRKTSPLEPVENLWRVPLRMGIPVFRVLEALRKRVGIILPIHHPRSMRPAVTPAQPLSQVLPRQIKRKSHCGHLECSRVAGSPRCSLVKPLVGAGESTPTRVSFKICVVVHGAPFSGAGNGELVAEESDLVRLFTRLWTPN